MLEKYRRLQYEGKLGEAGEYIAAAHREYPNDYRVMNAYMWDIAGGCADNDPTQLRANGNELLRICDCILGECTDEGLRLESMTMKAKLCHAGGDTEAALAALSAFPSIYQCAGQKKEQLFAKDTPEFRYWVKRNLYELAEFCADKAAKAIFFDDAAELPEKVKRAEKLGDTVAEAYYGTKETFLCLTAKSVYGRLANDLTHRSGDAADIIRIADKYLAIVKEVTALSVRDAALLDLIRYEHDTDNLLVWTINYYLTTGSGAIAKLREESAYTDMLNKYR